MSMQLRYAKARSLGYAGDPGLFGSLGNLITGGINRITGVTKMIPGPMGAIAGRINALTQPPQVFKGQPVRDLPLLPGGGRQIQIDMGAGGGTSLTKSGRPRRIRRDGKPWKRPSMNFGNGRAIRRAARRLEGAEKLFKRVFTIRHGKAPHGIHPKKV